MDLDGNVWQNEQGTLQLQEQLSASGALHNFTATGHLVSVSIAPQMKFLFSVIVRRCGMSAGIFAENFNDRAKPLCILPLNV